MPTNKELKLLLGLDRDSVEILPVDPRWSFDQAMMILTSRHDPSSRIHNQGRNRLIEAWATMVGGRRASKELAQCIASHGSRSAAAKALRTTPDTLKHFGAVFTALPEPHQVFPGFGVSLFFVGNLRGVERQVIESIKDAVLDDSTCRLTRFEEVPGGTVMRFDGGDVEEMEKLAAAFIGWTWQDELDAMASPTVAQLFALLDGIHARLARVELRLPGEEVAEWMSDKAAKHLSAKDRKTLETVGQRFVKRGALGIAKKLMSKVGMETFLDEDEHE